MIKKIFTFTRPSRETPLFTRDTDMGLFYIMLHIEGKVLLEKRSFSEDGLVYTRETHWASREVYQETLQHPDMKDFHARRAVHLAEHGIVMTEVL